jgi:hypothetical protein
MESSNWIMDSGFCPFWPSWLRGSRASQSGKHLGRLMIRRVLSLGLIVAGIAVLSLQTKSQSRSYWGDSYDGLANTTTIELPELIYIPSTRATKLKTYAFDTFGPYALVSGAFLGGIDQVTNTPPEWKKGFGGYSERFGSDFGIAAAGTTTRYLLAGALKQDTLYYRCECGGLFPRLQHAMVSTLTGRSERDGHRVFSIPALAAPYAGSLTAVYGWYPSRYGVKDAFRMGNYSLLESIGSNIALEFFYRGPHSLLSRLHLNNSHGALTQGPKP